MGPRRPLTCALFITIVTTIIFTVRYGVRGGVDLKEVDEWIHPGGGATGAGSGKCADNLAWLEPYQFTYPIQYAARDIITNPNGKRPSVKVMETPLFADFVDVDITKSQVMKSEHCLPPLLLDVPRARPPVDASNMIFGLQTTMMRLKDTTKHLARWLPNTGAQLYAMVIEDEEHASSDSDMVALENEMRQQGMNVTLIHPLLKSDTFAQRYFSLINVMYEHRISKTQWITSIDDDTFFPSMLDLQMKLSEYDASIPQYIGSLSEDWWAVDHYGLMGFGGAGILLSLHLAKIINDHKDECKENLRTTAGDISVMDCIYRFSTAKLTNIPELHQVDMHGDLSGFYESGRQMLSLHHWKEGSVAGYKLEMEKMHLVADICDSCFLQRWQFPHDMLLSNGFSITQYPEGHLSGKNPGVRGGSVDKINLEEAEYTWRDEINVLHSLAPTRPKMEENQKISYKLLDSIRTGDAVRQVYFKEGGEASRDTVLVLNWRAGSKLTSHEAGKSNEAGLKAAGAARIGTAA